MSFGSHGSYRPRRFARPQGRSFFANKKSSIHPSKYINRGTFVPEVQEAVVTHSFADFGLEPELQQNILRHGYTTPTPIQDQAIPLILEGRDVVGLANTGTGKTAAFLLPLINRVLLDTNQGVLIMAPTRELALQIADEFKKFASSLPLSMTLAIGGVSLRPQIQALRNNPHFVIGTPGRLKDLFNQGALDTQMFTNIVLDEVDRMLDIGFLKDITFLIKQLPEERNSYFFSATMTREVEAVMHSFLDNPATVKVSTKVTSAHIEQDIVKVLPGENKIEKLVDLLRQTEFEKVIVFGKTKHGINRLEKSLRQYGIRVAAIHGNKTQSARQQSLNQLKKGFVQALLATDVAARGIDVHDVTHVINYDEPMTYEEYIHRIGRTGRAGKIGKALTFVT